MKTETELQALPLWYQLRLCAPVRKLLDRGSDLAVCPKAVSVLAKTCQLWIGRELLGIAASKKDVAPTEQVDFILFMWMTSSTAVMLSATSLDAAPIPPFGWCETVTASKYRPIEDVSRT